jgi:tetrahydromethanopterin S-methyltransferase subunit H
MSNGLFRIEKPQKVVEIGGIKVGGRGENPVVLVGTIFYTGHKIVEKRKEGKFNREKAESLINMQETFSDETGIPSMLDVVALSEEEFRKYIDFISEVTDMPFMIDAWKIPPKIGAAKYVKEIGLEDRVIYNSLSPWSEDLEKEVSELRNIGLKHGLTVAYNMSDPTVEGRITLLKDLLLPALEKAGFENILIDTSVLNTPAIALSVMACRKIKEEFGLPVGCAPSNGTDIWKYPREQWGKTGFAAVDSAAHAITALMWNDFILYGAIENAKWVFPAVATANSILATFIYEESGELPEDGHPLNKLFPEFVQQLRGEGN